ncbi:hypothetical protein [Planomonospora sp. ID82291]|uniref:hypothetical protein n=1 Tax=Planomonospora sp. ID82291 TaxID=2738136 RepID=UPI0018C39BF1|nr:hypothetical protein [Planomonospora sp. ID82291]MBG0816407.1 hypothetical protein [Planomonospora sp. ID82291]
MAFFRPRVSREAEVRHHADQEVGKGFPELLRKARLAEAALREVQAATSSSAERRAAALVLDKALTEVLRAAEANQRVAFGIRSYDDRLRRRKGRATPEGVRWTTEVERLRTLRERNRLLDMPRDVLPVGTAHRAGAAH